MSVVTTVSTSPGREVTNEASRFYCIEGARKCGQNNSSPVGEVKTHPRKSTHSNRSTLRHPYNRSHVYLEHSHGIDHPITVTVTAHLAEQQSDSEKEVPDRTEK